MALLDAVAVVLRPLNSLALGFADEASAQQMQDAQRAAREELLERSMEPEEYAAFVAHRRAERMKREEEEGRATREWLRNKQAQGLNAAAVGKTLTGE